MRKFCEKCGSRMSIKLKSINTRVRHGIYTYQASCITDLKKRNKQMILSLILANSVAAVAGSVLLPFGLVGIFSGAIIIIVVNIAVVDLILRYVPVEITEFHANFAVDLSRNHENKANY